jgi:hypothetical protein
LTFILAAERHPSRDVAAADVVTRAFSAYRLYVASHRDRFPASAFALATSEWYFDFRDHRCPHDAWLDTVRIEEPAMGERHERRVVAIRARLLGAYHDGHIEFYYPRVWKYQLALADGEHGHRDWRYDEFRVTDEGRVTHEIEWSGLHDTGRWLIEASDVQFTWIPKGATGEHDSPAP